MVVRSLQNLRWRRFSSSPVSLNAPVREAFPTVQARSASPRSPTVERGPARLLFRHLVQLVSIADVIGAGLGHLLVSDLRCSAVGFGWRCRVGLMVRLLFHVL